MALMGMLVGVQDSAGASEALERLLPDSIKSCPASGQKLDYERRSIYVPAADGVELAVDIFLPKPLGPRARIPTLYTATRYWRASKDAPLNPVQQQWIAAGFAVVNADVRGTGASFGQWYIPYSPQEVRDVGYLAAWIAKQPWSDGNVVMTGNSYTGTTSLIGPAYGHGTIKAVAPKFSDFDLYTDLLFPGGVATEALSLKWGEIVRRLDLNEAPKGVRPVDGAGGESRLEAAIKDHRMNPRGFDQVPYLITFSDEHVPEYRGMTMEAGGAYRYRERIEASGVPIFGWGSWLDSGIAQGLLNRFMNLKNPQLTIIGPWTHGARDDVNVFKSDEALDPPAARQDRMIECYLSHYVGSKGHEAESRGGDATADHTLIYLTMGENEWKSTHEWPIRGTRLQRYYLDTDNSLSTAQPSTDGRDSYKVDFEASTGPANRWSTQAGGPRIDYGDRAQADKRLLSYTSAPLVETMEITGQPVVTLRLASTHPDGNFFIYLEDEAPDGRVTYLTEGQLRAIHRKLSSDSPPYKTTYPYRSFHKQDAQPLVPGELATLTFQLQATSVLLRKDHRIRVSIAGADSGTFIRRPSIAEGEVTIHVSRGGAEPSFIELPVVPRS
jgi:uncharacterized protein